MTAVMVCPVGLISGRDFPQATGRCGTGILTDWREASLLGEHPAGHTVRPSWSNTEYDALIKAAQTETDAKKRMDSLYKAEKMLMQEMPVGPLIFRGRAFVMKPYVKNFQTRIFGPDYELRETYIQGKK